MDKCHTGDHRAIEANHKVISKLQEQLKALEAENKRLEKQLRIAAKTQRGLFAEKTKWQKRYMQAVSKP